MLKKKNLPNAKIKTKNKKRGEINGKELVSSSVLIPSGGDDKLFNPKGIPAGIRKRTTA